MKILTKCTSLLWLVSATATASPKLLPFQGHLTQPNGSAVADGAKVVQFKIYDAPVSGTAVWAGEVHKLSVNKGLVNTILGTKTSFPARYGGGNAKVMFSEPLYVEITVDADGNGSITAADPPLLPRQVLLPANFAHVAMRAETVEGVDLVDENTNTLNPSVIKTGSIPGTAITTNSITAAQVAANSIGLIEMTDASVGSDEIVNGAIKMEDLAGDLLRQLNPPGTVQAFAGTTPPVGWLLCDGSEVSRASYAHLFAAIGTAHGVTDTSKFHLPDYRGRFLRGADDPDGPEGPLAAAGNDPDISDLQRTAMHNGGALGNRVGSVQGDAMQRITGFLGLTYAVVRDVSNPGVFSGSSFEGGPVRSSPTYPANVSGSKLFFDSANSNGSRTSMETRPKNAYVNYIIKY